MGTIDIEPKGNNIQKLNILDIGFKDLLESVPDYFITNPPWNRELLHPMIESLSNIAPTILLFDADWMHTKQSIPYLPRLKSIISIGRIKWIPDSKMTGKDNCCWYWFDKNNNQNITFHGRT